MSIIVSGNVSGVSSLKDKSIKIVLYTQEVDKDQAGELYGLNGKFVKVLLSDKNIIAPEAIEAVENFQMEEDGGKSPSQRLRGILYKNWERDSEGYKIFNDYYRAKMEMLCTHFKGKLN